MNPQSISGTTKTSRKRSNARNNYSTKTLPSTDGEVELKTPRDRDGTFSHNLFEKTDAHYTIAQQTISLYTKDMSTREIVATFQRNVRC
ncbi:TPA: transposase [Escherichia coli]|nr:transposase [Escherichia coli]